MSRKSITAARLTRAPFSTAAVVQSGETPTFEAFFQQHRDALTAFERRRTATEEDAREIVQESFVRILEYGYGPSRPAPVWKALLYRIAENMALSHLRRHRSHRIAEQQSLEDVEVASEEPSPERQLLCEQELALIRQALGELSPKCRKVFLLSRVHHKTYPEIATHCSISVKMVEKYMSQALAALRAKVGERP